MVDADHPRGAVRTSRFGEFQKKLGLAKNILTVRLRALVDQGILKTAPASDGSAYQEYLLTPKGRGVFPILVALRQWSEEFDERPEEIATILVDKEKGRPVRKLELYSQDGRLLGCGRHHAEAAAGAASALRPEGRDLRQLVLAPVRSRSSASSCAIPSKWPSTSSRWRSASLTNSATVSAMKATASSGPPSSPRSSVGDVRLLPEAVRFRPPPALLKQFASNCIQYSPKITPLEAQL